MHVFQLSVNHSTTCDQSTGRMSLCINWGPVADSVMLASMFGGLRWVLTQILLKGTENNIGLNGTVDTLYYVAPCMAITLLPFALAAESDKVLDSELLFKAPSHVATLTMLSVRVAYMHVVQRHARTHACSPNADARVCMFSECIHACLHAGWMQTHNICEGFQSANSLTTNVVYGILHITAAFGAGCLGRKYVQKVLLTSNFSMSLFRIFGLLCQHGMSTTRIPHACIRACGHGIEIGVFGVSATGQYLRESTCLDCPQPICSNHACAYAPIVSLGIALFGCTLDCGGGGAWRFC